MILNAQVLTKETKNEYIELIDEIIKVYFPPVEEDPDLFNLVKTYQLHRHSKTCRKYKNTPCRFYFGRFFPEKTVSEPLPQELPLYERETILILRKEVLTKGRTNVGNLLIVYSYFSIWCEMFVVSKNSMALQLFDICLQSRSCI